MSIIIPYIELYYPGQYRAVDRNRISLFLAGTIDNGDSEDWQRRLVDRMNADFSLKSNVKNTGLDVYNPRCPNWDTEVDVLTKDSPEFYRQVTWELDRIINVNVVAFNFLGNSASPISLMELGIVAGANSHNRSQEIVVHCPMDYYRRGNVEILCQEYGMKMFSNEDAWYQELKRSLIKAK